MLTRLRIRNFAIVDQVDVEFMPGMTVLTGETGAGKSILIDALGLALGQRGSARLVRAGAKRAEFVAEFDVGNARAAEKWLVDHALELDGECLMRRVIGADGRSRAFINGNAVPVAQLKTLGELLLDIHGQHFHQSLNRRDVQRDLLDHFAGAADLSARTRVAFESWRSIDKRLGELQDADADRASRVDLLTFQLQELDALDLADDEASALLRERERLRHSGKLADGIAHSIDVLFESEHGNANALIADANRVLDGLKGYDAELDPVGELVSAAGIQVAEAADALRRYAESLDMDPARLDRVEQRLDAIQSIARKHRVENDELPALRQRLAQELDGIANSAERSQQLQKDADEARNTYFSLAGDLTAARQRHAQELSAAVTEAMQGLGISGGTFRVAVRSRGETGARADGLDEVGFEVSANPGQAPQPLSQVASGGELSRISLAIQVIASDGSAIPTMIFDEVDSGVGGAVAEMVGRRLQELGDRRQVLCVTHLPQVASLAGNHFKISKASDGEATRTRVRSLDHDGRVEEIARMLGGVKMTQRTLAHAAEMLEGKAQKRA